MLFFSRGRSRGGGRACLYISACLAVYFPLHVQLSVSGGFRFRMLQLRQRQGLFDTPWAAAQQTSSSGCGRCAAGGVQTVCVLAVMCIFLSRLA